MYGNALLVRLSRVLLSLGVYRHPIVSPNVMISIQYGLYNLFQDSKTFPLERVASISGRVETAKKRKKPHKTCRRHVVSHVQCNGCQPEKKLNYKTCRRHVGKGGDLSGKRKKRRKERVGLVAANLDNLEDKKEAGGGAQGTQGYLGLK